jgi:hypothetical protein
MEPRSPTNTRGLRVVLRYYSGLPAEDLARFITNADLAAIIRELVAYREAEEAEERAVRRLFGIPGGQTATVSGDVHARPGSLDQRDRSGG